MFLYRRGTKQQNTSVLFNREVFNDVITLRIAGRSTQAFRLDGIQPSRIPEARVDPLPVAIRQHLQEQVEGVRRQARPQCHHQLVGIVADGDGVRKVRHGPLVLAAGHQLFGPLDLVQEERLPVARVLYLGDDVLHRDPLEQPLLALVPEPPAPAGVLAEVVRQQEEAQGAGGYAELGG